MLRERGRAETSLTDAVKRRFGIGAAADTVEEIRADVFDGVELPPDVEAKLDEAADAARGGDDLAGAEAVRSTFGSVCDREYPDAVEVGEGRRSRCLRHGDDYRPPDEVIRERGGAR